MKHSMWLMILFIPLLSFAQEDRRLKTKDERHTKHSIKPLNIGDKVPEIIFSTVVNYGKPSARLSDFKGKPIILDFWATWCQSCTNALPHLDSLNSAFAGKIQFLLVDAKSTGDTKDKVSAFITHLKSRYKDFAMNLPSTVGDSISERLFRHQTVPHYVWINENGVVCYTTSEDQLTFNNLSKFLNGQQPKIHLKKDLLAYNNNKPLFQPTNGAVNSAVKYQVSIMGYLDGLNSGFSRDMVDNYNYTRFTVTNYPIVPLYKLTNDEIGAYNKNRIIYAGKDSALFNADPEDVGQRYENAVTIEVITAPIPWSGIQQKLKAELDNYFNVTSSIVEQKVTCYVLKSIQNTKPYLPNDSSWTRVAQNTSLHEQILENVDMATVSTILDNYSPAPIIDQTKINHNFNIIIPRKFSSPDELAAKLRPFGITVEPEQQYIKVFYIHQ